MSKKRPASKDVDYDMLDATTDDDIARQIAEDSDTAPDMADWTRTPARVVRPVSKRPPKGGQSEVRADYSINSGRISEVSPTRPKHTKPKSKTA